MRKAGILLLTLAATALAQLPPSPQEQQAPAKPQPQVALTNLVERKSAPTLPDIYCGGFITNQPLPESSFVAADWGTPHQSKDADRNIIYLTGGSYQEGARYYIERKLRDPNKYEAFKGQRGAIRAVGHPYADIALAKIIAVRGTIGIAVVEFGCDAVSAGDLAVPFVERERPDFKYTGKLDPFVLPSGKITGRIVMARDFDQVAGTNHEVYLNIGSDQGVKAGDYFYATRTYEDSRHNEGDNPSFKATVREDTQDHPPSFPSRRVKELPRRALAEMMVLHTTPKSSTALITYSIEEVVVGDWAEMFEPPPPPVVAAPEPLPPVISCAASPATVRKGEGSLITCEATSPDNHPLSISFSTSAGNLTPRDNTANLDTASAEPGPIAVTGTATDDRNLSSNATATVNVEALPANPEPTNQVIQFKKGSARVDNAAKAVLDGVALQLQQAADASSTVVGHSDKGEAKSLANARANNIKRYLTQKGIDGKRIGTKSGAPPSSTGDVWVVPSGATPPGEEAPKP